MYIAGINLLSPGEIRMHDGTLSLFCDNTFSPQKKKKKKRNNNWICITWNGDITANFYFS